MKVRNNYNECLTNLACSIRKYFDLPIGHQTLDFIDQALAEHQPQNVVLILLDGLGANILERSLPPDAFLHQNLAKVITTVFPATTTAATTSLRTGLNPVEHGWLGWTNYLQPIDKVITLFLGNEKCHPEDEMDADFLRIKDQITPVTVTEAINRSGDALGLEIMPFGVDGHAGLDQLISRVEATVRRPGKKYIYAYDTEPDATMHQKGPDSPEAKALIAERSAKIAKLSRHLHDTLLIVTADHGHVKIRHLFLTDYPDLLELLERPTSIEPRATSFKVKPGQRDNFRAKFNQYFGDYYQLYSAAEVIEAKLFGDGAEHPFYRAALGDFLAIATDDVCLVAPGDMPLYSQHAGYLDDEIFVPVVVKYCE